MKSMRTPQKGEQPKTKFCWICSKKLRGKFFVLFDPYDGHGERVVHKICAMEECDKAREGGW